MSDVRAAAARVLVVDDDPFNRDVLEQELDALGHTSILAEDGARALAILQSAAVDVVLLDIMMPGVDGFEVLRRLQGEPRLRDVPVIVVSALHDLASTARGIELGAVDYLPKPFEPVLLKARLDACLERWRWRMRERLYVAEIEAERARADALLLAMLPREAVAEWKGTGSVRPRELPDVAVMFLDIVGFSPMARQLGAEETIRRLSVFNDRAEQLSHEEGVEKIKLIGDAVMVTGNLMVHHADPVSACVRFARRLAHAAASIGEGWRLRGGLASGAVVAGVIGRERFSFDLWGPTVNLAARLTAIPQAGCLHLDGAAHGRLREQDDAQALGTLELRGMGATAIFRVDLAALS